MTFREIVNFARNNMIETLSQHHVFGPLLGGVTILLGLAFAGWKIYYIFHKAAEKAEAESKSED